VSAVTPNEAMCPGASFVPDPREMTIALGDMNDFLRIQEGTDTIRIDGGEGADDLRGELRATTTSTAGQGQMCLGRASQI
jgi:hypothetical protein